jgi:hypothetical protein
VHLRDRLPDAQQLLVSVVWSDAEGVDYMLEGTVNGAGSALDWLAGREQLSLPELLAAAQAAIAAGLEPPLFLNGIGGLGSPFWRSDFESRFVGTGTTGTRLLAVLESIAFLLYTNYRELAGARPALHAPAADRRTVGQRLPVPVPGRSVRNTGHAQRGSGSDCPRLARLIAGDDAATGQFRHCHR